MTPNRLNASRSGKTPSKISSPHPRQVDLSRYTSPGLNFDQFVPNIGLKIVYTDLRLELTTVTALRPLLNAGVHSLAGVFDEGEDMHLFMTPPQDGVTAYGVFKDGHPLSAVYASTTKQHANLAWEEALQDQALRQNLTYPVTYPQAALDFCRMAPPLIAPSGPFLTHHILPGHFEYPDLFRELLEFESHLFCILSLSKDSNALDRN